MSSSLGYHLRLPSANMTIMVNFKALSNDSVIFSARDIGYMNSGSGSRNKNSNCDELEPDFIGKVELRITPCGNLMFTNGRNVWTLDDPAAQF